MSAFYERMQALATVSITKYGNTAELLNASQVILDTFQGIMGSLKSENLPASVITDTNGVLSVTANNVEPDTTHYIRFNDTIYKIIYVEAVNPAGTVILYQLYLSK